VLSKVCGSLPVSAPEGFRAEVNTAESAGWGLRSADSPAWPMSLSTSKAAGSKLAVETAAAAAVTAAWFPWRAVAIASSISFWAFGFNSAVASIIVITSCVASTVSVIATFVATTVEDANLCQSIAVAKAACCS
jgi:hypothetical protein